MKTSKQIISFALVFTLLLSLSPAAFAAGTDVTADTLMASAGEIVDFHVRISGNPGLAAFLIKVTYDPTQLALVMDEDDPNIPACEQGDFSSAGQMISALAINSAGTSGVCSVEWWNDSDVMSDGTLFVLRFQVLSGTQNGTYPIRLSYSAKNTVNADGERVSLNCENGSITVKSFVPTISAKAVDAVPGDEVPYSFFIADNPGIAGFTATIHYDSSALSLKSKTNAAGESEVDFTIGDAFSKGTIMSSCSDGYGRIVYYRTSNVAVNGILFTLYFNVYENAASGLYPINVEFEVLDINEQSLTFEVEEGYIGITVDQEYYTVTYDANGGEGAPGMQSEIVGTPVVISSTEPTRDGYSFIGWASTQDAVTAEYAPGDIYSGNASIVLYAVWEDANQQPTDPSIVASGTCGDDLTWTLDENGLLTISGSGAMQNYTSSSDAPWYSYRTSVQTAILESGVTSVGDAAFVSCSGLTSVAIPASAVSIGNSAFCYCTGLTAISIPAGVVSIGQSAFYGCSSLTSVTIPEGLTSIGNIAFSNCSSLTSVTIPASLISIGENTFYLCSSLTAINVDPQNENFCSADGVLFNKDKTTLIQYPAGKQNASYVIPEGVSSIGNQAFYSCSSLTSVTIPAGVTSIGQYAFRECSSLSSVTIPEGVTSIEYAVFQGCSSLTSAAIPEGLRSIGHSAFRDCSSLTSLTIPDSVTSIGDSAFRACSSLTSVELPADLISISAYAFAYCYALSSINIPEGVVSIGDHAFHVCRSLTEITIPSTATVIEANTFYSCVALASVTLPDTLLSVGGSAFNKCTALTDVWYGGTQAQWAAVEIASGNDPLLSAELHTVEPELELPAITEQPQSAEAAENETASFHVAASGDDLSYQWYFRASSEDDWQALETEDAQTDTIIVQAVSGVNGGQYCCCVSNSRGSVFSEPATLTVTSKPPVASGTCGDALTWTLNDNGVLTISGSGKMGDYTASNAPWCSYRTSIQTLLLEPGITSIGTHAFYGCSSLTSVTIPVGVTGIGNQSFYGCRSLTNVTIPEGATNIGNQSFYGCRSLTSVTIPEGMTSIGDYAFRDCSSLTSMVIPMGVTSIGDGAFYGCTSLMSVTIPEGVTEIKKVTFRDCFKLTSVTIPDGVTSIGFCAFCDCLGLTSVMIPEGVTSIGISAFSGCSALTGVTIPESVTDIGLNAFLGCSSLTSITIPRSVSVIGDDAFFSCTALTEIDVDTQNEAYSSIDGVLYNKDETKLIRYPVGKTDESFMIPMGVITIADNAFYGCSGLTDVTIPEGNTRIGRYSFGRCVNLTSVTIPESLTYIDGDAFYGCSALTEITIPLTVTVIETNTFYSCAALASVTLPETLISVGSNAFNNCTALANVWYGGTEEQWAAVEIASGNDPLLDAELHTAGPELDPPTITEQPQSVSAMDGDTVSFHVSAEGEDVSYQWYEQASGEDWTALAGETSETLSFKATLQRNGCQYRCEVSNRAGSVCSDAASLSVSAVIKPKITQQPASVTVVDGKTATFSVAATGGGLRYQWYRKHGSNAWSAFSGATSATLTITASENMNGDLFRCKVSNSVGGVYSNLATLTVTEAKPVVTQPPMSVTVSAGGTARFTVTATGGGLKYQWYKKPVGTTWSAVSGATSATLTVTAKDTMSGYQYRCKVTNSKGSVYSAAATLTVTEAKPVVTQQPVSVTTADGTAAKFTVKATGGGLKYQWYKKPVGTSWSVISGATSATLTITAKEAANGYQYRCKVTNSKGSVYSGAATLTVTGGKPKITQQPVSVTAGAGQTATFFVTATGEGLSYQWYRKPVGSTWSVISGATEPTFTVTVTARLDGYQYRCKVKNESGGLYSSIATLTVADQTV